MSCFKHSSKEEACAKAEARSRNAKSSIRVAGNQYTPISSSRGQFNEEHVKRVRARSGSSSHIDIRTNTSIHSDSFQDSQSLPGFDRRPFVQDFLCQQRHATLFAKYVFPDGHPGQQGSYDDRRRRVRAAISQVDINVPCEEAMLLGKEPVNVEARLRMREGFAAIGEGGRHV